MDLLPIAELAVACALESGADEAEAYVERGFQIGVDFEAGTIKSASRQIRDGVGIRAFRNRGLGFAYVNTFDEALVRSAAKNAASLAKASPADKYNEMPLPVVVNAVAGLYDSAAETYEVRRAVGHANDMLTAVRDFDSRAILEGGGYGVSAATRAVVNSRGIKAQESQSLFSCVAISFARDGEDVSGMTFEAQYSRRADGVKPVDVAMSAARQAVASLGARTTESFKGTLVLHPFAVAEIIANCLLHAVDAANVQKGMSSLGGKRGTRIASPLLTVEDDGLVPGGTASSSFDREGLPPNRLFIVKDGVLENFLYNSYTARKDKVASNGHATGTMRNLPSIGPTNVTIKAGSTPLKKLIGDVKRGVLVQRFAGWPEAVTGDFSGVVKGGFLIENGETTVPLTETLISGNVFELLEHIVAVSEDCRQVGPHLVTPYIRIDDVSITGK